MNSINPFQIFLVLLLIIPLAIRSEEEGPQLVPEDISIRDERPRDHLERYFLENRGQIKDEEVLFYHRGRVNLFLHKDGMTVTHPSGGLHYRIRLEDANVQCDVRKIGEGPTFNFFHGKDPDGWIRDVVSFEEVILENISEGTDLRLKMTPAGPKWELLLERGSMLEDVRLTYTGNYRRCLLEEGSICFKRGGSSLLEGPFVLLQENRILDNELLMEGGTLRFEAFGVDPGTPLVIDPVLGSSTFLGGGRWDRYPRIKVDPRGGVVLSGTVESTQLGKPGQPYDIDHNGENDIFVCRLDSNLSGMICGTYFGGSGNEVLGDLAIDGNGSVYIAGTTTSSDLPTTPDAFRENFQGGGKDGFALKLSSDLSTLDLSTYIGGSGSDTAGDIAISGSGDPFVCGSTDSPDLPATAGCYQDGLKGDFDAYVTRLTDDGTDVHYLSYLGGTGFLEEGGNTIMVDGTGRCIVAGNSGSKDFPTTEGAMKRLNGTTSGFVSRFSPDGSRLEMSTLIASGMDVRAGTLDYEENVYLTGSIQTPTEGLPVSPNAFDRTLTGNIDIFIVVLNRTGSNVLASTYLGADELFLQPPEVLHATECGNDITLDNDGNILVTGLTESYSFPLTGDAIDTNRDMMEAFVVKMDRFLKVLLFSTFIGGYEEDIGYGVSVDADGYMYISGETYCDLWSHDFPTTEGAYQENHSSQYDWFCTRFRMDLELPGPPENLSSYPTENSINLTWEPPLFDGNRPVLDYHVYWGNREDPDYFLEKTQNLWFNHTNLTKGRLYYYKVRARNEVGLGRGSTISDRPISVPTPPAIKHLEAGDSHVKLSWYPPLDPGSREDIFYELLWGMKCGDLENRITGISGTGYDLKGLTNGITYEFQVFARNRLGLSNGSKIVEATPMARPSPPTDLTLMFEKDMIIMEWNEPVDNGGSDNITYNVYRYLDENYSIMIGREIEETRLLFFPVQYGQLYTFYLVAVSPVGPSDRTEMVSITPIGPISPPLDLRGEEYGTYVRLFWERPFSTGCGSNITFTVMMGIEPSRSEPVMEEYTEYDCTIEGLTPGTIYYFTVIAFNPVHNSTPSEMIAIRPLELPSVPGDLLSVTGDSFLNISWSEPEYLGGDTRAVYSVHMTDGVLATEFVREVEMEYCNLTGLENGRKYFIRVTAVNSKGEGPFSEVIEAVPMKVPSPPQFFSFEDGDGYLRLTWDVPFDLGGDLSVTYDLFMGSSGDNMSPIERGLTVKEYHLSGLNNGAIYHVGVRAVNSKGPSEMAGPLLAMPLTFPGPPTDLKLSAVSEGIMIEWSPPEENGGSDIWYYHVTRNSTGEGKERYTVAGHMREYLDTEGLERGGIYEYTVTAENSRGESVPTVPVTIIFPEPEEDEGLPMFFIVGVSCVLLAAVIILLIGIYVRKGRAHQ